MKIETLIIGLVVAFGVGFMVGNFTAPRETNPLPANYNPQAALESQAAKAAQEQTKLCYDILISHLDKLKANEAPAH